MLESHQIPARTFYFGAYGEGAGGRAGLARPAGVPGLPTGSCSYRTVKAPGLSENSARAKRRGAAIFFRDEAGVRSDSARARRWGAKGQPPVVEASARRQSGNAIAAVSPQGALWSTIATGRLNAARFIRFLGDVMRRRAAAIPFSSRRIAMKPTGPRSLPKATVVAAATRRPSARGFFEGFTCR
jgi:DDE superfamily endonuclease